LLVTIILCTCISLAHIDGKREYTKTVDQSFTITSDGTVDLENLHGEVDVSTWAKNEVEIRVTIRVSANSDRKAESTFDRIQIDFSNDEDFVKAETEISSASSTWWFIRSWWGDSDIQIDYEVFMPESANLEVTNQYGDIDVEDIFGDVKIDLKHGQIEMDHAAGQLKLDLSYGNGVIAKANETTADLAYFKLRINDANKVQIDSKFSKITIESANEIDSDSSYDGYKIGDVGVFRNDGKFDKIEVAKVDDIHIESNNTDVDIDLLTLSCDTDMKHGSLKIDRVGKALKEIRVESRYVGIEIELDELSTYRLQIEADYTSVKLPDGIEILKENTDEHHFEFEGVLGEGHHETEVYIEAEYGGIRIY